MRPFFIGLSIALGFNISPNTMAQFADMKIQGLIHNFQFDKKHAEDFILSLNKKGEITTYQASKALEKLGTMTQEELQSLIMDSLGNVHAGQVNLFAYQDEKSQEAVIDDILSKRSPASLSEVNDIHAEEERKREKLKQAQLEMLKTGFDIKKYQ